MPELEELRDRIAPEISNLLPTLSEQDRATVVVVASLSDYFLAQLRRYPQEIAELFQSGDMARSYDGNRSYFPPTVPHEQLDATLRHTRRREMCRVIYRDLTRLADMPETTTDLSNLADAAIDVALSTHYEHLCQRYGVPMGQSSAEPQQMSVLALGKLGAGELNLSSDIDLIFLFDEEGSVNPDRGKDLTNQEFFTRLSRALIASLDHASEHGFVFRVDMRLRPYGDSGALILNRAAMEKYFVEQGRDWERYAFIKARACAGDIAAGERFLAWLTPFVYRRHLDFGAIDSLREMKRLINHEVEAKQLHDDVKLGHGGIREIEFIVQACQLVWGGNSPRLRERKLLRVLTMLCEDGMLPEEDEENLRLAYHFLRNSEHALQAEADRQTQRLPEPLLSRQRLAAAMGHASWEDYRQALDRHREIVSNSFAAFMSSNNAEREILVEGNLFWVSIWQTPASPASIELLAKAGFADPAKVASQLTEFDAHLSGAEIQEIGAERISRLMPVMLSLIAREKDPDNTLGRMLSILSNIARRSTYVAYLLENLDALKRSIALCAMSPWIVEQLHDFPILLYELSDRVTEDREFDRERLLAELRQTLGNIDPGDFEAQMDSMRQWKRSAVLKVAVFELLDLLPIMKASDALTWIAEVGLQCAYELSWAYLCQRHGAPCTEHGVAITSSFAIVAYGKLGGIELGYGSDLDLVFLHDADTRGRTVGGSRPIENSVFYQRLGQRVIHILTSYTRLGTLYETDLRLRPDGNKGPMVSTFASYERYLNESAWTWEHQALVRARFVAGDPELGLKFDTVRSQVLGHKRDRATLLQEVVEMREKMRLHLDQDSTQDAGSQDVFLSGFDLKHGAGAIVDIEFMVQFMVLAHATDHPTLSRWTDKMRILDEIGQLQLMAEAEIRGLQKAYLAYRAAVHYQWLGGEMTMQEQLLRYRADVVDIWRQYMTATAP